MPCDSLAAFFSNDAIRASAAGENSRNRRRARGEIGPAAGRVRRPADARTLLARGRVVPELAEQALGFGLALVLERLKLQSEAVVRLLRLGSRTRKSPQTKPRRRVSVVFKIARPQPLTPSVPYLVEGCKHGPLGRGRRCACHGTDG